MLHAELSSSSPSSVKTVSSLLIKTFLFLTQVVIRQRSLPSNPHLFLFLILFLLVLFLLFLVMISILIIITVPGEPETFDTNQWNVL